jgi:hypothetical protein
LIQARGRGAWFSPPRRWQMRGRYEAEAEGDDVEGPGCERLDNRAPAHPNTKKNESPMKK